MKKLFQDFTLLYAGWITITLFTKEDINLAVKYTAVAFGFAFCVSVIPYTIKRIQDYYKNKTEKDKK